MVDRDRRVDRRRVLPVRKPALMIRTVCDQCDRHIGRVQGDWLGVDHARLDDDGELIQPEDEYQHHFCSFDCLQRWAFAKAFTLEPANPEGA